MTKQTSAYYFLSFFFHSTTEMIHFNIANIHSVRSSWNGVRALALAAGVDDSDDWVRKLSETGWMKQIRSVLAASQRMAQLLHYEGVSVVNHCRSAFVFFRTYYDSINHLIIYMNFHRSIFYL